jgi:hypothetical protein
MVGMKQAWTIAFAGALALAVASPARVAAGLVPGSGPSASNCYVELDVAGVTNPSADVAKNKKITCTDGNACDTGACGDGICRIGVRVCWNQSDPNAAGCAAPSSLDSVKAKGKPAAAISLPASFAGSSCTGSFVDVVVPTKKNGSKAGKAVMKLVGKAPKGTKPRTDADVFTFVCQPRVASCPSPTTTTAAPASTTTSSEPKASTTTTTGAPTTTTHGKPSTTTSTTDTTTTTVEDTTTTTEEETTTTSTTETTTSTAEDTTTTTAEEATTTSTTDTTTTTAEDTTTTAEEETTTSTTDTTTTTVEETTTTL